MCETIAATTAADERAREVEERLTDDERFELLISVLGHVPGSTAAGTRDPRIPEDVTNMSAGYTSGVPRLGIPAIQSSDASMGVTNPGYRPDDEGAPAFPALIAQLLGAAAQRSHVATTRRASTASHPALAKLLRTVRPCSPRRALVSALRGGA